MKKKSFYKLFLFTFVIITCVHFLSACKKVEFKIDFIVDSSVYATVKTNGEEVVKMPTDPQKEGYEFDGWYWDNNSWKKSFTANSLLDAPLSSNMSVYAKWTTPEQVKGTQAEFEGFDKISETEYSMKVANSIETLSLSELVTVNSRSSWTLSTDIYGNQTTASKIASLVVGDNTYYVLVKAENGSTQLYTLKIRRRPIYNVIFDTTGGTIVENQKVEEDSFASAPTTTKKGYTFVSWNYDFNEPITENKVVIAEWEANNYRINYDANGGELDNKYTDVSYDAVYKLPIPTKKGYDFCGWYRGEDLVNDGVYKNVGDINLKASWKAINYKITYDLKGGSLIKSNPLSYTIESNNIILNNPTKLGYEFIGWTGTDISKPSKGVIIYSNSTGDRTYTANWKFNGYKINYHLNGGLNNENNPIGFTIAFENIYLKNPTKEGYIFGGWYKNEFFTTTSKITMIPTGSTGDIDIYAKWTPITYSVKFNANGGSGVMNNQLFTYDIEQNLDENKYTRTGYTFLGWSNSKNDIVSKYTDKVTVVNLGNKQDDIIEFYAIWKANTYEIRFDGNGATSGNMANEKFAYDTAKKLATNSYSKLGYEFVGWNTERDGSGTNYSNNESILNITTKENEEIVLYAQWKVVEYSITYNLNGGTNNKLNPNKYTIEDAITLLSPTKEGYIFTGWTNDGQIQKGTTGALTFTASWEAITYTITFNSNGGSHVDPITQVYGSIITAPNKPTLNGRSFAGWFTDSSLTKQYNFTTMPAENITLYAKWIEYSVSISCDETTEISINDDVTSPNTYNATAIDTDGNSVNVVVNVVGGTFVAGKTVTVRLVATGLNDAYATKTISNIKIYGTPSLTYDTTKDYFNLSDTLNDTLWTASAIDTFGNALNVNVSVKETTYKAGDLVTIVISTTDIAGNETKVEIENVKVYGNPTITRDTSKNDMKVTDIISNELFGVSAVDSFGVELDVTTVKESGTFAGGNIVTVKSSTTDSKGNTADITYSIKVYGTPSISSASTTSFKVSDDITLDTLEITAKDSFGNTLTNVTLELTSGTQIAGATLTYLVTATDHLGNVNTREITGIKIYGTPTISYDTEKDSMKVTDTIDSSLFSAIAKDSFNDSLSVNVELNSGTFAGGNIVTFKLSTIDALGNTYETVSQNIKVYSSDDIVLTYTTSATNIKITSIGEEFGATAVNSFGETCVTSIEAASGYTLAGGNIINLYIAATDALGNTTKSELISNIKVYDIPTLVYTRDYPYIQNGDSPYALFQVLDSFGNELLFNVEIVSGSLDVNETITYRITATDKVKNNISIEYTLVVLDTDESILELYYDGVKVGTQRVYKGSRYTLPKENGLNAVWCLNETILTDENGVSLVEWDQESGGYILTTDYYTIIYDANGGEVGIESQIVNFGASYTLPVPTREGWTFIGWYNDSTLYQAGIWNTKSDVVLTANWISKPFIENGNQYIYFGEYPQTLKQDSVTITSNTPDSNDYYLGSDGARYAKVEAQPYSSPYYFSNKQQIVKGTTYYFKVEPIKWKILQVNGTQYKLVTDLIIDNQMFHSSDSTRTIDGKTIYASNYEYSDIRKWLNEDFYNKAFTKELQAYINITLVDNSLASTGDSSNKYICNDTHDKVYLLSYKDITNEEYGFTDYTSREKQLTDYAKAKGCYMNTRTDVYNNGYYWLRSPNDDYGYHARYVSNNGDINYNWVYYDYVGVSAAITISLS